MERWLNEHWVPAALCIAIALIVLLPVLAMRWNSAWLLIYVLLPVYMLHQVEEHTGDRFRRFVNEKVFGGTEGLSHTAVLWINLPGVWGVGLASIYAATFAGIGWGTSMIYLTLVNAILHIVAAVAWREYNPGLWTALILFVPLGALALVTVSNSAGAHWFHHAVGIGVALLIHVAIVVYTRHCAAVIRGRARAAPSA
jgi:hypothetical protein